MSDTKDPIGALIEKLDKEAMKKPLKQPIDDYSGQKASNKRPPLDDYFAKPDAPKNNDPLSGLSDRDRGRVEEMCKDKTLVVDAGISPKDLGNVKNTCLTNAREDLAALGKITR